MPLYICNSAPGAIPSDAKAKIADDITSAHCDVTDAPARFVHTAFFENHQRFPLEGKSAFVVGTIRAGRTDEQKSIITDRIKRSILNHAGISMEDCDAYVAETPASWIMEGGEIMPEPGEEAAWLKAHAEKSTQ
ncbi:MAG: tautomerase family protein [Pseudomonadota bacterium]